MKSIFVNSGQHSQQKSLECARWSSIMMKRGNQIPWRQGQKLKNIDLKLAWIMDLWDCVKDFFFYFVSLNYLKPTARLNEFCWWVRFSNENESNIQGMLKHCRSNLKNYVKEFTVIGSVKGYTCIYKIKMTCHHAPRDIWGGFEWKAVENKEFCYSLIILEREEDIFYLFFHFIYPTNSSSLVTLLRA